MDNEALKKMMIRFADGQPVLREKLDDALAKYDPEMPGLSVDFFVSSAFKQPERVDWKRFFEAVEVFCDGSEDEKTVVCTFTLETFSNMASLGKIDPKFYEGAVGPLARKYIVAWDRANGTRTPGF